MEHQWEARILRQQETVEPTGGSHGEHTVSHQGQEWTEQWGSEDLKLQFNTIKKNSRNFLVAWWL